MNPTEMLEQKIAVLREKGLEEEILAGYIADALELAFIRTLMPTVESLPVETYQYITSAIEEGRVADAIQALFNSKNDVGEPIDEKTFALHLKEALEI